MITNGTFDNNRNSWNFYVCNSSLISWSTSVIGGMFVNNITKTTGTDWHFGFQESGLSMKKGKYKLTFDAYAGQQKTLLITVSKNYSDWGEIVRKNLVIGTMKKSYELFLDMPRDDENVRLYFGTGQFTGKFYIDNISLLKMAENPPTQIKENVENASRFKVYPNPANGTFTIQLSNNTVIKDAILQLYSISGREMYKTFLANTKTEINPGNIGPGLYVVKVNSGYNNFGCSSYINTSLKTMLNN